MLGGVEKQVHGVVFVLLHTVVQFAVEALQEVALTFGGRSLRGEAVRPAGDDHGPPLVDTAQDDDLGSLVALQRLACSVGFWWSRGGRWGFWDDSQSGVGIVPNEQHRLLTDGALGLLHDCRTQKPGSVDPARAPAASSP